MITRRMVGGVLATAILAGGGIALAPSAFAQPRECGYFINETEYTWNVFTLDSNYYGNNSPQAQAAFNVYYRQYGYQLAAGC
jgi:hypothetical protein